MLTCKTFSSVGPVPVLSARQQANLKSPPHRAGRIRIVPYRRLSYAVDGRRPPGQRDNCLATFRTFQLSVMARSRRVPALP
jgi:hypothetical protein